MYIFGGRDSMRGCYMEKKLNAEQSCGAILTMKGVKYPAKHQPLFVTNVSFAQKERFSVVQCFNDHNYVYAFGHDPTSSMLTVRFIVMMAGGDGQPAATSGNDPLKKMLAGYSQGRLVNNLQRSSLTIGTTVLSGFVLGMESSTVSAEFNLHSFDLTLLLAENQKGR
jgi:hypothetical protein